MLAGRQVSIARRSTCGRSAADAPQAVQYSKANLKIAREEDEQDGTKFPILLSLPYMTPGSLLNFLHECFAHRSMLLEVWLGVPQH